MLKEWVFYKFHERFFITSVNVKFNTDFFYKTFKLNLNFSIKPEGVDETVKIINKVLPVCRYFLSLKICIFYNLLKNPGK